MQVHFAVKMLHQAHQITVEVKLWLHQITIEVKLWLHQITIEVDVDIRLRRIYNTVEVGIRPAEVLE